MAETYGNGKRTMLASPGLTNVATSMNVTSATGFPSGPSFRIRIGDEILLVTAGGSGTTVWTVSRGQEGTTAVSHPAGAYVYHILTAGALAALLAAAGGGGGGGTVESTYATRPAAGTAGRLFLPTDDTGIERDTGSTWNRYGPIFPITKLNHGDYTQIDSSDGSNRLYEFRGNIYYYGGTSGDTDLIKLRAKSQTLSAPWSVILGMVPFYDSGANKQEFGVAVRDSATGKFITLGLRNDLGVPKLSVSYWDNLTTRAAGDPGVTKEVLSNFPIWLRINHNFSARRYWYSYDGIFWTLIFVGTTSAHISAPNQIGFFHNARNVAHTSGMKLLNFTFDNNDFFELKYTAGEPSYF
jgi:hypothetical protein